MNPALLWTLYTIGLFLGMLLLIEVGCYIGAGLKRRQGKMDHAGFGVIEAALFALMGLILAFSFSGAGTRFDARRQLIVDEANCVGTAYLRLDLLPQQERLELQEKFRQYVDVHLAAYAQLPDLAKARAAFSQSAAIQNEIWTKAIAATENSDQFEVRRLLLPALNAMFDISNSHYMAASMHPPLMIYGLMIVLILICSLLAGFEMGYNKVRSWLHIFSFAVLLAVTVYTIIDLEFPRLGFFNVNNFDQVLVDLRKGMK